MIKNDFHILIKKKEEKKLINRSYLLVQKNLSLLLTILLPILTHPKS